MNATRRRNGFSLIEVLIALLVLAIGLLGLAALQAQGLKFNNDAYTRSQSNIIANDILDRMRTNRDRTGFTASYVTGDLSAAIALVNLTAPQCSQVVDGMVALAGLNNVNNDVGCWLENAVSVLPNPTAHICQSGVGGCPCPAGVVGCPAASSAAPYVDVSILWMDRELNTQAECVAVPSHQWYPAENLCRTVQTWTIYP